jgi:hypothetical protein
MGVRRVNRLAKTQSQLLDGMRMASMFYEASISSSVRFPTSSQLLSLRLGSSVNFIPTASLFSLAEFIIVWWEQWGVHYYCCFLVLQYFFFIFYIYMQGQTTKRAWTCGESREGVEDRRPAE